MVKPANQNGLLSVHLQLSTPGTFFFSIISSFIFPAPGKSFQASRRFFLMSLTKIFSPKDGFLKNATGSFNHYKALFYARLFIHQAGKKIL